MKFKAYPKAEIFCTTTKRTLGYFDKHGFFETDEPAKIKALKALGYKAVGVEKEESADLTPLEYFSKLPKSELQEQAKVTEVEGFESMTKAQLIEALIGE